MEDEFSRWCRWSTRSEYPDIKSIGIYVVAISREDISKRPFAFTEKVVYIGMTNAVSGLRGRLVQFDNTIAQRYCQHGGADRVLYKHQDYSALAKSLYVAMQPFDCSPQKETPSALRAMGRVANAEFECMARCVEKLGRLPEFNRKKDSPKYSLTYGRNRS